MPPSQRSSSITLVLTPIGASTRDEMIAGTYTPPPEMLTLDAAQLRLLRDAVGNLPHPTRTSPKRA